MNFLNIKKGPKMEFIVGEHRNEFEKEVLNLYCESDGGFWNVVPSLEANIMRNLNPKYAFAGLLGALSGDPSDYHKKTFGKVDPDFERIWAAANLARIEEQYNIDSQRSHVGTAIDAISVLDYHHMFFMLTMDASYPGTGLQGVKNVPLTTVW